MPYTLCPYFYTLEVAMVQSCLYSLPEILYTYIYNYHFELLRKWDATMQFLQLRIKSRLLSEAYNPVGRGSWKATQPVTTLVLANLALPCFLYSASPTCFLGALALGCSLCLGHCFVDCLRMLYVSDCHVLNRGSLWSPYRK